jgi:hypothetical protein
VLEGCVAGGIAGWREKASEWKGGTVRCAPRANAQKVADGVLSRAGCKSVTCVCVYDVLARAATRTTQERELTSAVHSVVAIWLLGCVGPVCCVYVKVATGS